MDPMGYATCCSFKLAQDLPIMDLGAFTIPARPTLDDPPVPGHQHHGSVMGMIIIHLSKHEKTRTRGLKKKTHFKQIK